MEHLRCHLANTLGFNLLKIKDYLTSGTSYSQLFEFGVGG